MMSDHCLIIPNIRMSSLHLSFTPHYMSYSLLFVEMENNHLLPFEE